VPQFFNNPSIKSAFSGASTQECRRDSMPNFLLWKAEAGLFVRGISNVIAEFMRLAKISFRVQKILRYSGL